ncbi:MAG TPA: DUF4260 domain-containing protein [Steroidobacteraceae bacterium]|nr:DUF4260 domain-containing protein [Steroidobacteraceae bacterium]
MNSGGTTGGVRLVLRLEGALILAVSLILYQRVFGSWEIFALCFLLPDVSFAGYLLGPSMGALFYNSAHSYIGPLLCAGVGLATGSHLFLLGTLIWSAHIGFDRALGYGLKYSEGFGFTHLGRIGREGRLIPTASGESPPVLR